MYLFFDTETTGKPKDYKKGPSGDSNWPHIVQIAWLLTDGVSVVEQGNFVIDVGSKFIEPGAEQVHGMSQQFCNTYGVKLKRALIMFSEACKKSEAIIAHNYNFDSNVIASEMIREGIPIAFLGSKSFCTMELATDFCKLPGGFGGKPKWPKLSELHQKLFDSDIDGAHNAMVDVEACARCFFKLVEDGVINVKG